MVVCCFNLFLIVCRPQELKTLRVLVGSGDKKEVFAGFDLLNLDSEAVDASHTRYTRYLEAERFIPTGGQSYWSHTATNEVSTRGAATQTRGLFNIFPLNLMDASLDQIPPGSMLGNFTRLLCRRTAPL